MPICGIYKIENLINHHCYIGQSTDVEKRWADEYQRAFSLSSHEYNYPLSRAFRKYPKEVFSFSVIEQCEKEKLNEKERYWISYYDSFFNGYNQTLGGDSRISTPKENIVGVINDLKTTDLIHKDIANKWGISQEMVQGINTGRYWFNPKENYPLQKASLFYKEKQIYICQKCGKEISKGAILCRECYKTSIQKVTRPTKEELKKILFDNNGNFSKVAKQFGVSDRAIRKWCDSYNISHYSSDYKIIKNKSFSSKPKKVAQIDNNTNEIIAIYDSISDAQRALDKPNGGHISSVCKGTRETAYGYKWKYIED